MKPSHRASRIEKESAPSKIVEAGETTGATGRVSLSMGSLSERKTRGTSGPPIGPDRTGSVQEACFGEVGSVLDRQGFEVGVDWGWRRRTN